MRFDNKKCTIMPASYMVVKYIWV